MSVLRSTTFQLQVKNEDGTTKMRSFMRSVSDADKTVDKLNESLGENTTVTAKTVQSVKELTAQARLEISAIEKANKAYQSQSEQLAYQISLVGKSEAEQAALTAQFKLGADATDKQRESVGRLATNLSLLQQKQAAATKAKKESTAQLNALIAAQEKESAKTNTMVTQYTKLNSLLTEYGGDVQKVNAMMQLGTNATKAQVEQVSRLIDANRKLKTAQSATRGSMRNTRGVAQNLGWQLQDTVVQLQMGTSAFVVLSQQGSQFASAFGPAGAVVGAIIAVTGALTPMIYQMVTGKSSAEELSKAQEILNSVFDEGKTSADDLSDSYGELYARNKDLALLTAMQAEFAAKDAMKTARQEVKSLSKEYFSLNDNVQAYGKVTDDVQQAIDFMNKQSTDAIKKQSKELGISVKQYRELSAQVEKGAYREVGNMLVDIVEKQPAANRKLVALAASYATASDKISTTAERIKTLNEIQSGKTTPDAPDAPDSSNIVKAFEAEYARTIKQTETTVEEYKRRKSAIDAYVTEVGSTNRIAADAYSRLEQWKTSELKKESDKRDAEIAKAIQSETKRREKALKTVSDLQPASTSDPVVDEMKKHNTAIKTLYDERNSLQLSDRANRKRINAMIESENDRHQDALSEAQLQQAETYVTVAASVSMTLSSIVDTLSTGAADVEEQMENMNTAQKAMFYVTQTIAAAEAVVNGISLGMKLAETFPLVSGAMIAIGTSLGAAQAGAIMGTTIAGAFDEGGTIPSGQAGIVAEYGNELVGGTMVYNNSGSGLNVTGRKDTEGMLADAAKGSSGTNLNVSVVNNAPGVQHQVQQSDDNNIRIIASQVFAESIDQGVAGVISKRNSKANKSFSSGYRVNKRYS